MASRCILWRAPTEAHLQQKLGLPAVPSSVGDGVLESSFRRRLTIYNQEAAREALFTPRECNKAAHLLAATGMKDGGNRYWMKEEPCFLVQQIREDKRQWNDS
ncbi:hypothetical protein GOBAR_DD06968 [Gossypium barbadense]|nr:hypothetical protein GOBAR_DD06968 [Gossypium barbadense]